MKIKTYRALTRADVRDLQPSTSKVLEPLNDQVEEITKRLQNHLSFGDNFDCEVVTIPMRHDAWIDITLRKLKGKPTMGFIAWNEPLYYTKFAWEQKGQDLVRAKVFFDVTPAPEVEVKTRILFVAG